MTAAEGTACSELENCFYYCWRLLATVAALVLSLLLYQSRRKIDAMRFKLNGSARKKNDDVDWADAAAAVREEDQTLLGRRRPNFQERCQHEDGGMLRKRIFAANETISPSERSMDVGLNEKPAFTTRYDFEPRTLRASVDGAEAVVIGGDARLTGAGPEVVGSDNYRVAKIVTTVEVTLQPSHISSSQPVKADALKREEGGDLIDSPPATEDAPAEEAIPEEPVNSLLEVVNAHTIEEVLDKVETLEAVADIIREAGLEWSNLIFGIDYTASNKFQGEKSFRGKSLHAIEPGLLNPYQQVISVLGKTLAPFANSGFIAGYGFGDARTEDTGVFPLKTEKGFCASFSQMLNVYNDITPTVILSGPTNFAPLIYEAIKICKQIQKYHILVIVADGQVTNESATREAIVEACQYPLSIIVVGVGDGPWDMMQVFDGSLPKRTWDNFHFVEFQKVTTGVHDPELSFAVQALMEIPDQYKKIKALGLLDNFAASNGEIPQ